MLSCWNCGRACVGDDQCMQCGSLACANCACRCGAVQSRLAHFSVERYDNNAHMVPIVAILIVATFTVAAWLLG
jgi:hypothetical protein